ncbi:MAG: hypothetical protein CMF76_09305 [Maricaulis sp.]|nr:hypothetical protein [Oceanicaulis sp.]MAZ92144.1 hypothetical protein [Maricaulis sp.]
MLDVWPEDGVFDEVVKRATSAAKREPVAVTVSDNKGTQSVTVSIAAEILKELGWSIGERARGLVHVTDRAVFLRLQPDPLGGYRLHTPPGGSADKSRGLLRVGWICDAPMKEYRRAAVEYRIASAGVRSALDLQLERVKARAGRSVPGLEPEISPAEVAARKIATELLRKGHTDKEVLHHLEAEQNIRRTQDWLAQVRS